MKKNISYGIRPAVENDVSSLLKLVKKLAEYERLTHEVSATEELYRKNGFSNASYFKALLVEKEKENDNGSRPIGFALYFFTFSTFTGNPTLYLEDIFVLPEFRGQGIGKALLVHLAKIARGKGCERMEWAVLDWNEPAIRFFKSLEAKPLDRWTVFRLNNPDIRRLANS